ncbi:MAG TPA: gfo/Idh/MocA family oxidoreductase, partial [Spirochaetota bacterium]|nr:gfo/Idh/MocA family oxidoreductase [Spirochaetota bacterium]
MKKQDVNIALIGCGRIGHLLELDPLRNKPCTHFGGALSAGLAITHACDINRERLERFGKTAGIAG